MRQSYRRWGFLISALVHLGLGGGVAWLLLHQAPGTVGERKVPVRLSMFQPPPPEPVSPPPPVEEPPPAPPKPPPEPPPPEPAPRREPPPPPKRKAPSPRPARPVQRPAKKVTRPPKPEVPAEAPPRAEPRPPVPAPPRVTPAVDRRARQQARASLEAAYLARLQAAIERHKYYPRLSRRRGEEGRVMIELTIGRDGTFQGVRVKTSSGYRRLDGAALETLRRVGHADPLPPELGRDRWQISVPMVYTLRE